MGIFSCRPRRTCKSSRALRSRSSCSAGRSGSSRCSCNPRGPRRACQPIPSCRTCIPGWSSHSCGAGRARRARCTCFSSLTSRTWLPLLSLCSRRSRRPCIPRRTGRARRSGWPLYTDSTPRPGSSGSSGRSGHSWHAAGACRAFFSRRAHRPRCSCSSGWPGHYYDFTVMTATASANLTAARSASLHVIHAFPPAISLPALRRLFPAA